MAPPSCGSRRWIHGPYGGHAMPKNQLVLLGFTAAALVAAAHAQQPAPSTSSPPAPYVLTMGDMMNTLIQPRHAKLGLAGAAGNWPLAAYALAEIRQDFDRIAKAVPKFRGYPVGDLADAA